MMKQNETGAQMYLEVFQNLPEVKAFFSTRHGAVQGSPYENETVFKALQLESMQRIQPQQVHKNHIAVITQKQEEALSLPETDGMITNLSEVLLTTVHADCLPVWFYDPVKKAIGLVHAGWRGTVAGIAPKAVKMMKKHYDCCPEDILCHIGPGISSCCFETGAEVYEEFKKNWDFTDQYARVAGDKYKIDLKGINREALCREGLVPANITISPHCTCCEPEVFCSYRREGGTYSRMGAGICLL